MNTSTPLIISMMYCLDTEQGHIFGYNKELGEIATSLGWEHTAAVRAAARVRDMPGHWHRALGSPRPKLAPKPFDAVLKFFLLVYTQWKFLKMISRDNQHSQVLFLEWFNLVHVVSLVLSLFMTSQRRRFHVWLMYRLAARSVMQTLITRFLHTLLEVMVGSRHVKFLSDSNRVAKKNALAFRRPFSVLPIPHTRIPNETHQKLGRTLRDQFETDALICWWPGMPSTLKGASIIQQIIDTRGNLAQRTVIVLTETAGMILGAGDCRVHLLPGALSDEEYWSWMSAADVILLPYDPDAYADRTSGIFTEAVVAGKLPLVREGTWMANELHLHEAEEFIIDWSQPNVLELIHRNAHSQILQLKLAQLQKDFELFHSNKGYALALKEIWQPQHVHNAD